VNEDWVLPLTVIVVGLIGIVIAVTLAIGYLRDVDAKSACLARGGNVEIYETIEPRSYSWRCIGAPSAEHTP
jgi:hypothetical protein